MNDANVIGKAVRAHLEGALGGVRVLYAPLAIGGVDDAVVVVTLGEVEYTGERGEIGGGIVDKECRLVVSVVTSTRDNHNDRAAGLVDSIRSSLREYQPQGVYDWYITRILPARVDETPDSEEAICSTDMHWSYWLREAE